MCRFSDTLFLSGYRGSRVPYPGNCLCKLVCKVCANIFSDF